MTNSSRPTLQYCRGNYTIGHQTLNILFSVVCFQDEVKQLSSWKFFDWNTFDNRFGNDVFEPKKLMVF